MRDWKEQYSQEYLHKRRDIKEKHEVQLKFSNK